MPKRTNEFQKLVYLVRLNLAADAKVTESAMLKDRVTGEDREVDVCIEGNVGGTAVRVCIECRDHARRADVQWVEAMMAKHKRLPTNALILASRTGFSKPARELAQHYRVEAISMDEIDQTNFPALLDEASSLWTKLISLTPTTIIAELLAVNALPAEDLPLRADNLLHASDGAPLFEIGRIVEVAMRHPEMRADLFRQANEGHRWFEVTWQPACDRHANRYFLMKLEPPTLRRIESLRIAGPCEIHITQFGVRRARLGDIHLAWGNTELAGESAIFVATRDHGGPEKIALGLTKIKAQ